MIRIGLPLPYYIQCPGMESVTAVCRDPDIDAVIKIGANIWQLRNASVNDSVSSQIRQRVKWDYFLSVDADISFTRSDIDRLISRRLDIVSGAYNRRDNPRYIHAGNWEIAPGIRGDSVMSHETGIKKVDWVGGGFLLVSREALEIMEYPWWRSELIRYGNNQEATSADFGFCMNAKRNNIDVVVDMDTRVKHERLGI